MNHTKTFFNIVFFACLAIVGQLQSQNSPLDVSNCVLWLRSDSLITLDGNNNVESWGDLSASNITASQTSASLRPIYITSGLNNYPALQFNGDHRRVEFDNTLSVNEMTLFVVCNPYLRSFNGFMGGPVNPHFFCLSDNNTSFRMNGDNTARKITVGNDFVLTDAYQVIDARTSLTHYKVAVNNEVYPDSAVYTSLPTQINKIGRRAVDGPYKGEILEFVVYDKKLSSSEIDLVYAYLFERYGSKVDLGADIVSDYSLCVDTLLTVDSTSFSQVIWNDSDTSFHYNATEFGQVVVQAKDNINRVTYDTLLIAPPLNTLPESTHVLLCVGDSITLNTGYSHDYSFQWQDSSTDSVYVASQPGAYWCIIADSELCDITTDTFSVVIDSFSVQNDLGESISVCAGDQFEFTPSDPLDSILWSTGEQTTAITIHNTGTYSIYARNENLCVFTDSVLIQVSGQAPLADFLTDTVCFGDSTQFLDLSSTTPPDSIGAWLWQFEGADTSSEQNPLHLFSSSGMFHVTLSVLTDSGCANQIIKPVVVKQLPDVSFNNDIICADVPSEFMSDAFIPPPDSIVSWSWMVNGQPPVFGETKNLLFPSEGVSVVQHAVLASNGCSDTATSTISVFPSFVPDFSFHEICFADSTQFLDETPSFSVVSWFWEFGDSSSVSTEQHPTHFYEDLGDYMVRFTAENAIGCQHTVSKTLTIHPQPFASWESDTFCVGEEAFIRDISVVGEKDSIEVYVWNINDDSFIGDAQIVQTFSDTGHMDVSLFIETTGGCSDDTAGTIYVANIPTVYFEYDPVQGNAPVSISFDNQSIGASEFAWDFDDPFGFSTDENPVYLYQNNGIYNVTLEGSNVYGCSSAHSEQILLTTSEIDIELRSLSIEKQVQPDGSIRVYPIVSLRNVGSRPIYQIDLLFQVNNDQQVGITWSGDIDIGETEMYHSTNFLMIQPHQELRFVCMEAISVNESNAETNYTNNTACSLIEGNIQLSAPYPSPANGAVYLDIISSDKSSATMQLFDNAGKLVHKATSIELLKGYNQIYVNTAFLQAGVYVFEVNHLNDRYLASFVVGE